MPTLPLLRKAIGRLAQPQAQQFRVVARAWSPRCPAPKALGTLEEAEAGTAELGLCQLLLNPVAGRRRRDARATEQGA
jgi:hypothetical protein